MALITKDRVKESTTTTGTGAYALGGADATFDTFTSCMSNGDTTYYAVAHTTPSTDEWEVGIGTWNTGNTLTRTTVLAGSNGTSAVNFSAGTKNIFMTVPADQTRLGITATVAELNFTDGVTSNIQTQLDAKQPYHTIAVTVVNSGGNKYALDGTVQQTALIPKSVTVRFDQSDSSNAGHPLRLSTTSDGTHASGSAFSTGVTAVGTPGSAGAYTQVTLEQDAPDVLYTYCTAHSGMGATVYSGKDLSTLTSTVAELNILDGVTSTAAELNILDGVTSTTAELNILDGVTSTTAELNILDGVTATATELNIMDGVTATTAELNYVDGVTSNIQTQLDSKLGTAVTGDLTFNAGADLLTATAGTDNIRIGENAGDSILSGGNENVVIGKNSGTALTTGDYNVAVGVSTLKANTEGVRNTAVGYDALLADTLGSKSTALGFGTLTTQNLTSATDTYNTAVGYNAGNDITTGTHNTLIGSLAGDAITTGLYSTAVGYAALSAHTTANGNTAVGYEAGMSNTTGYGNTFMGYQAGKAGTTAANNTFIGQASGTAVTDANCYNNVGVGHNSLASLTTGNSNVAVGQNALGNITTVSQNTAVGAYALYNLTSGTYSTAVGYNALNDVTTANYNTCVGVGTGHVVTTGAHNVGLGDDALPTTTTGSYNISIGRYAGYGMTTASHNCIIGYANGYAGGQANQLTGGGNTLVSGGYTNVANAADTDNVIIGFNITGKGDNTGYIGGSSGIYGQHNSSAWYTVSDRRIKKNITDSPIGLAEINQIKVRNWEYKTKDDLDEVKADGLVETDIDEISGVQVGAVAQELQAVLPKCVREQSTGVLAVDTDNLTWHLVKAVQELSAKNDALEARIKTLEG